MPITAFSNVEGQADSFAFSRDYFIDSKRLADRVEGRSKSSRPHIFLELLTKNPKCSCHTEFPKQLGIYGYFKDSPCSVLRVSTLHSRLPPYLLL